MTYLDFYNFARPYREFGLTYGTSMCGGYIPEPPRNQIPPLVGQNDLFEALQAKLGHIDLIRNISPMHWNRKVQLTSKYF